MNILLAAVNAKYIHSCPAVYSLRASSRHPEIVEIAEFTINDRYQDILAGILEKNADIIGFSAYIWNTNIMRDLIADIRRVRGNEALLFAGGPEASSAPERFLPDCDFVICREGERPFKELAALALAEDDPRKLLKRVREELPGAAYLADGSLRLNPALPVTSEDFDRIPFPYDDLRPFDNRILYYESSRGCPFSCSYCLSSIDKHVRFRSLDKVFSELRFFIEKRVPQVKFIDRTFNCNHERTKRIWTFLRDHDKGLTNFHFEIGADLLDEEELAILEGLRPGLVQLEIGIQSTNPETLAAIRRVTDLPRLYANIRRLRRARNINLHLDLIAGLPYEDLASFGRSFDDVYRLHADQLQLGFLKLLAGTAMEAEAEAYDIRCSRRPPYEVLSTKWLSCAELDRLRRICDVLEYYYNSRQFIHSLDYLEPFWESAFSFFGELADFFRARGYDKMKPAAARRYEALDEFVTDRGLGELFIFREYLRFDQALHIHKSRKRSVSDVYNFGRGKVHVTIDYGQRDLLTGEAGYTLERLE
ncbi:MAG: DUF4080 domain-containing protein [Lachnospiraceae bacterium]|nr:DUF4080 domain-containing protein [Lachnospiraceae bacterium]